MNKDQVLSAVRSLLKVIGSALAAHGATKAAGWLNAEDTIGLILTIAGFAWSHWEHSDSPAEDGSRKISTQKTTTGSSPLLVGIGLIGLIGLVAGCVSSATAFFRAEKLAVDSATGTMHTYNLYYSQATNAAAGDAVKCAKLDQEAHQVWGYGTNFYHTITVVDSLRAAYEVNAADTNRTALVAALSALSSQATNISDAVKYFMNTPK